MISKNVVCATSKASDQPAHTRSLIRTFASREYSMIVKLLTEHHLEFLSLKGGCRGSSESTHVKMPQFWKSHALAQITYMLGRLLEGRLCPCHRLCNLRGPVGTTCQFLVTFRLPLMLGPVINKYCYF